jgi:hypothetical protein
MTSHTQTPCQLPCPAWHDITAQYLFPEIQTCGVAPAVFRIDGQPACTRCYRSRRHETQVDDVYQSVTRDQIRETRERLIALTADLQTIEEELHPLLCFCDQLVERMISLGARPDEIQAAVAEEHECVRLLQHKKALDLDIAREQRVYDAIASECSKKCPPPPRHGLLERIFEGVDTDTFSADRAMNVLQLHCTHGNASIAMLLQMQIIAHTYASYEDRVRALESAYRQHVLTRI